jgi:hypothetical protein
MSGKGKGKKKIVAATTTTTPADAVADADDPPPLPPLPLLGTNLDLVDTPSHSLTNYDLLPAVVAETANEVPAINNNDSVIVYLQTFTATIISKLDALKSEVANMKVEYTELTKRKITPAEVLPLDGKPVTLEQFTVYITECLPLKFVLLSSQRYVMIKKLKRLVSDLNEQDIENRSAEDIIELRKYITGIFKST